MIGWLAKKVFEIKTKAIMKTAVKDPRFKSALEGYVKGTNEFRKKLKDYYGVGDVNDIPRF